MEKNMENEMETGIIGWLIGIRGYMSYSLNAFKVGVYRGLYKERL